MREKALLRRAEEAESRAAEYDERASAVVANDRRAKIRRGVLLARARAWRRAARISHRQAEEIEKRRKP